MQLAPAIQDEVSSWSNVAHAERHARGSLKGCPGHVTALHKLELCTSQSHAPGLDHEFTSKRDVKGFCQQDYMDAASPTLHGPSPILATAHS